MSRQCAHVLESGRPCKQPVADPARLDCGRHADPMFPDEDFPKLDSRGCRMWQAFSGSWRCLTHNSEAWEAAIAMGAHPPCRIPLGAEQRVDLADSPVIEGGTAAILARDPQSAVREALAGNAHTPKSVLLSLLDDPNAVVLSRLTTNEALPQETAARIIQSDTGALRWHLARYTRTTATLEQMAGDASPSVRQNVAFNQHTPDHVLRILADEDTDLVCRALARRHVVPPEVLIRLAHSQHQQVRLKVASRDLVPRDALRRLVHDVDKQVQKMAKERLLQCAADAMPGEAR